MASETVAEALAGTSTKNPSPSALILKVRSDFGLSVAIVQATARLPFGIIGRR